MYTGYKEFCQFTLNHAKLSIYLNFKRKVLFTNTKSLKVLSIVLLTLGHFISNYDETKMSLLVFVEFPSVIKRTFPIALRIDNVSMFRRVLIFLFIPQVSPFHMYYNR